jgi:hypothetical protein
VMLSGGSRPTFSMALRKDASRTSRIMVHRIVWRDGVDRS